MEDSSSLTTALQIQRTSECTNCSIELMHAVGRFDWTVSLKKTDLCGASRSSKYIVIGHLTFFGMAVRLCDCLMQSI